MTNKTTTKKTKADIIAEEKTTIVNTNDVSKLKKMLVHVFPENFDYCLDVITCLTEQITLSRAKKRVIWKSLWVTHLKTTS